MSHPALTQLRALRYFTEIPALEPSLVTGYVKFCYVPMVNRGLPVVPSFLCQR